MRKGRSRRTVVGVVVGLVALLAASSDGFAEGKTAFLADQLKNNADFRVRTSAALSLGTSDDAAAVKPLCTCLDSASEVESVRVACAAALGKLKKPGTDTCLKEHANDSSSKVKEQVATSLKALGGSVPASVGAAAGCPNPPPASKEKPKYYVGVAVSNKSSRPDAEIKSMVEKQVRCKLVSMPRFRFAEDVEPKKMAAESAKDKLDGYYLSMSVDPIKYDSGNLKVSMKLTIMTATRDLKGEIAKSLTMPGVSAPSKSDEDDLIKTAAEKLAADFAGLKP